jgi:HSP20 family protein
MHRLIKIRIIRDLEHVEERMRVWRDRLFSLGQGEMAYRPPVDLYETLEGLVLRLEIPGVAKEDLAIDLAGQELVIRGRRRPAPPSQVTRVLVYEISYGTFERSFLLPIPVDPEGVRACYTDGILEVRLPRHQPRARRIPVKELTESSD